MNRISKFLCALCTALLFSASSFADDLANYQFPDWNDYEITFVDPDGLWVAYNNSSTNRYVYTKNTVASNSVVSLSATVTVDDDATFCFENYGSSNFAMTVYLDGNEVLSFDEMDMDSQKRRFIEMGAGTHTIAWTITNISSSSAYSRICNIGVEHTPTINVNLLESGSLGSELLYNVERLQDVRKLKIKGEMNDDDWAKIDMIKANLFSLDLSEAKITEISKERFENMKFLHTIVLPEGFTSIGDGAFSGTNLINVNFPSTLTTLGYNAFNETCIMEAIVNDACIDWNSNGRQFYGCHSLRNVKLPTDLKKIPTYAFCECYHTNIPLHEGITTVGNYAFYECYNMHPEFPSTLTTIGTYAFQNINTDGERQTELVLPDNVSSIGSNAFRYSKYTSAVMPVSYNNIANVTPLPTTVKTIKLKSPTLVKHPNNIVDNSCRADITLVVPDYLVNAYKLDSYWYNFGTIVGFDTEEIANWSIADDLILDAHARLKGTPSVEITAYGSLKINGTDAMPLNNLTIWCNRNAPIYGRIFSNADGVTIAGSLEVGEYLVKNRWYYLSLPYNVKVGDITNSDGAKKAVRYYDGANRAENGTGNNWKNYTNDDIIPAGTGFIFQSSADSWWYFPSQEDESKQYMTSNRMFVKELAANVSATASNSGWNLVGNPYQCWYNIHKLNFTAPITVRNESSNKYEAYSIIDDDYAIKPNQAFFVQCPEGTSEISFPLNGRQMTSEITSQNGAPAKNPQIERVLVDVQLNDGESSDRTRVVLNSKASLDYETTCDASKFLSEANVAQVYTLDADGTQYAINERPMIDGEIQLGVIIPADGTYSFSLLRNMADNVYVRDNETGTEYEITEDAYEFYAEAGTNEARFTLVLKSAAATGICSANAEANGSWLKANGIYNLNGQRVGESYKGIVIKNGKKILR